MVLEPLQSPIYSRSRVCCSPFLHFPAVFSSATPTLRPLFHAFSFIAQCSLFAVVVFANYFRSNSVSFVVRFYLPSTQSFRRQFLRLWALVFCWLGLALDFLRIFLFLPLLNFFSFIVIVLAATVATIWTLFAVAFIPDSPFFDWKYFAFIWMFFWTRRI